MAETKFIFTADDSQLQSAIERVKKSLSDIGLVAESTGKTGDNAFGDLSADLGNVEQKVKDTTKSFTEYSAKINALKSEIASIESEIGNLPKDADNSVIQQKLEQVKQLTEQMQELQKAEADQFAQNGVKFTFAAPPTYVEDTKEEVVDFSATANFEKTIEQLNVMREGLAATRAEYEQISQKANTGESDFLQLAYTNDALDKTKERFTELSKAYYSANGALEQLTKELEAARADGNAELSKQISTQIAQLDPIVKELKREYEEIVSRGDELGSQKSWLSDSVKEAQESAKATRDYATEVKILNQELSGLKSQLDGINVGDKEKEAQLNERIRELQERITELHKLEAQQLQSSGVKFTLVAPEATTSASVAAEQVDYSSNIEKINQQSEALAQSRAEYEKVLAAIQDTDSKTLQLANTNDALASTFTRIGSITNTLQLAADELKQLNAELEKAKTNGDKALAETLSKQIEEVKSKVPALNKELQDLVKTEEELKQKQRELQEATEAQRSAKSENNATSESAEKVASSVENVKTKSTSTTKALGELTKGASQVRGGFQAMASGSGGVVKGLSMITSGIKSMSKALLTLLANPWVAAIAAIIAALSSLMTYFTKTSEGADKFAKIKGTFSGIMLVMRNWTIEVGRWFSEIDVHFKNFGKQIGATFDVVKNKFKKGELKGLLGEMKDAWSGAVPKEESAENEGTAKQIIAASQKLAEDERKLTKAKAEWEVERAKLKEEKSDLQMVMYSGSQTEQIAAMDEMRKSVDARYKKEIEFATEALRIQQEKNKLAGKNVTLDEQKKERELEVALINLTAQRNSELRMTERRYKSVTNALKEQKKASEKELVNQQRENEKLSGKNTHSADVDMLKLRIKYENDVNEKLKLQQELRKKNLEYQINELNAQKQVALQQNEIDKEANIKKVYGEEAFEKWKETGELDDTEGRLAFYEKKANNIIEKFDLQIKGVTEQSARDATEEQLDDSLTRHEQYLQGMLDAEQQYQEKLKTIRERYGLAEDADVENSKDKRVQADVQAVQTERTRAQEIVKRDTGIQDSEMVTELAELGGKVAGKAMEEVRKIYDGFISDVNAGIQAIEKIQTTGKDAETLKSEAEMQLQTTQAQIATGTNEQGEVLSEAQKVELLKEELLLKQEIAAYDDLIQSGATNGIALEERKGNLVKVRSKAEVIASNAAFNSLTKQEKQTIKQQSRIKGYTQSLSAVKRAADSIADAFGGSLSKGAKKALGAMSDIADFGMSTISSIESLTKGTMQGMEASAMAASTSISTVEKASVILTVISLVIQAVMAIVKIASQFTTSAQLQESIDEHLAKVDELQKRQQLIESQYATSQGSDYYKGLVKSGNEYKKIIEETNKALADAEALYKHNLATYGADSDKTKEAKEQRDDIAADRQESMNAEIEHWRSLMEEISGISLDSFAENLADALIEGFAEGKEGIGEVWEDTMDDLLRTMMRNQLATALKDQFKDAFTSLENATKEDGVLSDAEMQDFMNNLEAGKEKAEQIAGAYYDAMSEAGLLDDADAEGSQGFGQMTQDQADALTARFTAVQIEMANVSATTQAMAGVVSLVGEDIKLGVAGIQSLLYNSNIALQMAQDQLDQMQVIADNTAMLVETNTRLKAIETNTSRL